MAKARSQAKPAAPAPPVAPPPPDAESLLARGVAIGLPLLTLFGAIAVGLSSSLGPAVLVVVTGMLLGAILLLWTSLRSLAGDAPIDDALDEAQATMMRRSSSTAEKKRIVLRSLKDLELEHSVGKIDDEDYDHLVADYREQAKVLMKEMDVAIDGYREKAEQIARAHLAKRGLGKKGAAAKQAASQPTKDVPAPAPDEPDEPQTPAADSDPSPDATTPAGTERLECAKCATSNEPDATFCKKCGAPLGEEADA